jgi:hypothetical protein
MAVLRQGSGTVNHFMKFKNLKKEAKSEKSPSNSRRIPAFFSNFSLPKFNSVRLIKLYREVLIVFVIFIFILTSIAVGLDFRNNLLEKQKIDLQRETLTKELNFWKEFLTKHQDYRDAYLQASILEYKLGDISKAKMYVQKGLSLDPNSESGRKIEALLK